MTTTTADTSSSSIIWSSGSGPKIKLKSKLVKKQKEPEVPKDQIFLFDPKYLDIKEK